MKINTLSAGLYSKPYQKQNSHQTSQPEISFGQMLISKETLPSMIEKIFTWNSQYKTGEADELERAITSKLDAKETTEEIKLAVISSFKELAEKYMDEHLKKTDRSYYFSGRLCGILEGLRRVGYSSFFQKSVALEYKQPKSVTEAALKAFEDLQARHVEKAKVRFQYIAWL